jgi:hypothetical protein
MLIKLTTRLGITNLVNIGAIETIIPLSGGEAGWSRIYFQDGGYVDFKEDLEEIQSLVRESSK